jgi:hypothetical protein
MKRNLVLLLVAALALVTAGTALAAKGKPTKHPAHPAAKPAAAPKGFQGELRKLGISCPAAAVELNGSFGGAGDGFMALVVSKATGKAATLKGKQVSLRLLKSTKINRNGPSTASKLKPTDRVSVVALMCTQGLVARTITATPK